MTSTTSCVLRKQTAVNLYLMRDKHLLAGEVCVCESQKSEKKIERGKERERERYKESERELESYWDIDQPFGDPSQVASPLSWERRTANAWRTYNY